jgi:nitrite reductase (NO-forming)
MVEPIGGSGPQPAREREKPATPDPPLLSELLTERHGRRAFLKAGALGLALPAVGALAGCSPGEGGGREQAAPTDTAERGGSAADRNASSRADTGVHAGPGGSSGTPPTQGDPRTVQLHRFDPTLPPVSQERTLRIDWTVRELPIRISDEVVVAAWTFEGDIPGPILHVRQGDTVEFTMTNRGAIPHSMDFHAAQIDPKVAFKTIVPGQSVTFTCRARYPGAFMYHCGTAPVLMHIGTGMFGAIIVDPPSPLPPAKEFVLVQSEYYLKPGAGGVSVFDYEKMLTLLPDHVAFNGRPGQYIPDPIKVKVGDRVRFYVVNAGPTHPCAFHVVGEQFDRVYLGSPPDTPLRGVQTFNVPAGGGMVFEYLADIAGEFPFVNHGFGHGQKGAVGFLVVEP